jgi:chromosome transmission fidelity protein 18
METVTALTSTIPPGIRSLYTSTTVLTELAPLLMRIISPPLKPVGYCSRAPRCKLTAQVNAGIVKPDERATLSRLVEIMIHVGLRFYQEKQEDGQPQMRLEP